MCVFIYCGVVQSCWYSCTAVYHNNQNQYWWMPWWFWPLHSPWILGAKICNDTNMYLFSQQTFWHVTAGKAQVWSITLITTALHSAAPARALLTGTLNGTEPSLPLLVPPVLSCFSFTLIKAHTGVSTYSVWLELRSCWEWVELCWNYMSSPNFNKPIKKRKGCKFSHQIRCNTATGNSVRKMSIKHILNMPT